LPINDFGYFLPILHPGQTALQYAIAFFFIMNLSPLLKQIYNYMNTLILIIYHLVAVNMMQDASLHASGVIYPPVFLAGCPHTCGSFLVGAPPHTPGYFLLSKRKHPKKLSPR
jgi:hypothetical protein